MDHPAPTNCTKYVVLRPNTAPSPAPTTKPPLLPKRPKTSKIIRKVPEIEFALKWDLKENDILEEAEDEDDKDDDEIEVVSLKKGGQSAKGERGKKPSRGGDPPTPRSVSSVDSGVHVPRAAWHEGPDTGELASKLERLRLDEDGKASAAASRRRTPEPESGYGTPKSAGGSLPSVASRASSGRSSCGAKLPLKVGSAAPPSPDAASRRISMDAQRLAEASPKSAPKSRMVSPGGSGRHSAASRASFRDSARSSRSQRAQKESSHASGSPRPPAKEPPVPKLRDPLEIMETMDSVFHTVPLRDTGRGTHTCRSEAAERRKGVAAAATQTEEQAQEFARRAEDDAGGGAGGGLEAKVSE